MTQQTLSKKYLLEPGFNQNELVDFVDTMYIVSQIIAEIYFRSPSIDITNISLDISITLEDTGDETDPTLDFWLDYAQGKEVI